MLYLAAQHKCVNSLVGCPMLFKMLIDPGRNSMLAFMTSATLPS